MSRDLDRPSCMSFVFVCTCMNVIVKFSDITLQPRVSLDNGEAFT